MRGKSRNVNENPGVKPVEKIELSEKSPVKRLIIAGVLLAIGLGFLGYALVGTLSKDEGWTQIETVNATGESVAVDLVLLYDLGASGRASNLEYKEVSNLYTQLCSDAYRLFHAQYGFDDVHNPYYINRHLGEEIQVDPALYTALEKLQHSGSRVLFAAPFYTEYQNMFLDTEDASAALLDPRKNPEIAAYFAQLSQFTADPAHVDLKLLGNNTVQLLVSQAYQDFAAQNGIENYIDFYWTRNAFVVDFIAESLMAKGYSYGTLSSFDGFLRSFDERETVCAYDLYACVNGGVYRAAELHYTGSNSLVCLRAFRVNERDEAYYTYENGEQRHAYIDPSDGYCKNSQDALVAYSYEQGCADVLLSMLPVYMTERFQGNALTRLKNEGIYSVRFDGTQIVYNDPDVQLKELYQDPEVTFTSTVTNS